MSTLFLVPGFQENVFNLRALINGPIVRETPRATQNIRKIIAIRWEESIYQMGGRGGAANKVNGSKNNFIRLLGVLLIRYS